MNITGEGPRIVLSGEGSQVAVSVVTGSSEGGGGVSDHGLLSGLADDDHEQYALADGSRGAFATTAQGDLADSAVQPGDLATVATSGAYSDLSGTPTGAESLGDLTDVDLTGAAENDTLVRNSEGLWVPGTSSAGGGAPFHDTPVAKVVGRLYGRPESASVSTVSPNSTSVRFLPFRSPWDATYDRLYTEQISSQTDRNIRLLVYAVDAQMRPTGAPIRECAPFATSSGAAIYSAEIPDGLTLERGEAVVFALQVTAGVTVRSLSSSSFAGLEPTSFTAATAYSLAHSYASGAPTIDPSSLDFGFGQPPLILARVAS